MKISLNTSVISSLKIVAMCSLFWLALAAWGLATPVGVSPDEDFHQTMIYCAAKTNDARCSVDGKRVGHCYSMYPFMAAKCSGDAQLQFPIATKIDWSGYPPLYYKTMHLFVGESLRATTRNVRLANLTLALLLAILSVSLSHPNIRRAVAIAWLVCSVPLGIFFVSSISPSAWAIVSVAAVWGPLLTLFCRVQNPFVMANFSLLGGVLRVLFILGVMALGLGSRGEPFIFIPLVFTAAAIYWFMGSQISWVRIAKMALALLAIIFAAFILILAFDQVLMKINGLTNNVFFLTLKNYFLQPHWKTFQLTVNTLLGTLSLTGTPGSEIGTHDVPTPALASFLITIAFGTSFLLGLAWMDRKKAASLVFLMGAVFFIVSFLWSAATWDVYQSRYFLPILYPILGLALLPNAKIPAVFNRLQWLVILVSAALANSLMLLSAELRFIYGVVFQVTRYPLNKEFPDINPLRLFAAEIPNWWLGPEFMSPFLLWVLGSLSFLLAVLLLFQWVVTPQKMGDTVGALKARGRRGD
jgi:hypothetical protein